MKLWKMWGFRITKMNWWIKHIIYIVVLIVYSSFMLTWFLYTGINWVGAILIFGWIFLAMYSEVLDYEPSPQKELTQWQNVE